MTYLHMITNKEAKSLLPFLHPLPDGKPGESYITAKKLEDKGILPCQLIERKFYGGVASINIGGGRMQDVHLINEPAMRHFAAMTWREVEEERQKMQQEKQIG